MQVHIITVGDEILIGQIVDTNSAWLGQQLNAIGWKIGQITSVADEASAIREALHAALAVADVVLMTGGLGPTKDDITKKTLADYFDTPLVFHADTYERLRHFFERLHRQPSEAHREQCHLPAAADILTNAVGTAPGMWFEQAGKITVSLPGVPYEMKYLMEQHVLPRLAALAGGQAIYHRTLCTVGQGESDLAEAVADVEAALPPHIKLAFLPNLGQVRLRLSGSGNEAATLVQEIDAYLAQLHERVAEWVYSDLDEPLAATIGRLLVDRQLTLGTAESCTAGYLAYTLAQVPGASRYLLGGVVAYANDVKMQQLGVQADTLRTEGAVSEATVREMVHGARQLLGVDIAVAISGIAGPGGGTPEKPVGTIWVAVGDAHRTETLLLKAGKTRQLNMEYGGNRALGLLWQFLRQQE